MRHSSSTGRPAMLEEKKKKKKKKDKNIQGNFTLFIFTSADHLRNDLFWEKVNFFLFGKKKLFSVKKKKDKKKTKKKKNKKQQLKFWINVITVIVENDGWILYEISLFIIQIIKKDFRI